MFNKNIKIVLAALITIWAIYQFSLFNIMNGISILFLAGIFVLLYFKNEFILLSFLQLRKQNFPGAQKWLGYIKNPIFSINYKTRRILQLFTRYYVVTNKYDTS